MEADPERAGSVREDPTSWAEVTLEHETGHTAKPSVEGEVNGHYVPIADCLEGLGLRAL